MHKVFPIKSATACQLKWTWSTILLYNGRTNSCHRVFSSLLEPDTFKDFHNTPRKLNDRKLMLAGEWPSGGCEYCRNIEAAGGFSDRMLQAQVPGLVPPELDDDPSATRVTPRIVEVYFDNVCNMSCIYCWDGFSSKIQQENIRHGRFEQDGMVIENRSVKHPDHDQLTDQFWEWMDINYMTVRRLHVLGGEPFYQSQFDTCMEFLEARDNPDLEFNVVSNLMISHDKLRGHIERIKTLVDTGRIARFDLTASIDCWGPEQEYVRHGLDLELWRKNFEYLVDQHWIRLNINQTITNLSIKTMPELIEYINQFRKHREIGQHFMTVSGRTQLSPDIFGGDFWRDDFVRILKIMPGLTHQQVEAKKYMMGIMKQIQQSVRNDREIHKLIVYLDELDRRRKLDWRKTFTWLTEYVV